MEGALQFVPGLRVLSEVQSDLLGLVVYTKAHRGIEDFDYHKTHDELDRCRGGDANNLLDEMRGAAAVEEPVGAGPR